MGDNVCVVNLNMEGNWVGRILKRGYYLIAGNRVESVALHVVYFYEDVLLQPVSACKIEVDYVVFVEVNSAILLPGVGDSVAVGVPVDGYPALSCVATHPGAS